MSAIQPLFNLVSKNFNKLSKEEHVLLEAELFISICMELKEIFREQHKEYFHLIYFTMEMENTMLEANFLRLIIRDILASEEYTLEGIAHYTDTHEDVIQDIIRGCNANPSALLLQRIIELHRSIRRELYLAIIKKITNENLMAA